MCYFLSLTFLLFVTCTCFHTHCIPGLMYLSLNSPSLQRVKEEISDRHPSYLDTGYAIGVVLLFISELGGQVLHCLITYSVLPPLQPKVSGIILTIELPSRCYSGPNEHFKALGQAVCNLLTVMAVIAWLGVLTSKSCP